MTKIIFIINDTQIALTKSPDPLDQVLDRIAAQTFPLPADTRPEDWAAINGVLVVALSRNPTSIEQLSPRQRTVLELLTAGSTRGQIAQSLRISPPTVDFHLDGAKGKFKVATRNELIARFAAEREREKRENESTVLIGEPNDEFSGNANILGTKLPCESY